MTGSSVLGFKLSSRMDLSGPKPGPIPALRPYRALWLTDTYMHLPARAALR